MAANISVEITATPDPLMSKAAKSIGNPTKPTEAALALVHADITEYPPKPAGSTYVRTGRLASSWESELDGKDGVLGRVRSSGGTAKYNIYVQDADRQAPNMGHWSQKTAQAVAQRQESEVAELFADWIEEEFGN